MLHEVQHARRAEGLLVGHHRQRQAAVQLVAHLIQVEVGKDRGRGPAAHVATAAPVHLAVDQLSAPGVAGPPRLGLDREHVDVPVEDHVLAGTAGVEAGDVIGSICGRGDPVVLNAPLGELRLHKVRRFKGVAGRIGGLAAHEPLQKINQHFSIGVYPPGQYVLHGISLRSVQGGVSRSYARQSGRTDVGGFAIRTF